MRKPIIAGNWKMNKNYDEAVEFIKAVADKVPSSDKVETAICAPALYLRSLVEHQGENLRIGAQICTSKLTVHSLEKSLQVC